MMSPGDVRTFKSGNGNSLVVGVGLWAKKDNNWIHIHITGPNESQTTVTNNPDSQRYHRTLFRNLRRTLVEQGCWPYGDEGAETELKEEPARFRPVAVIGEPVSTTIIRERGR